MGTKTPKYNMQIDSKDMLHLHVHLSKVISQNKNNKTTTSKNIISMKETSRRIQAINKIKFWNL